MSSEVDPTEGNDEDLSCGLLLRDIEEISKALYLHKSPLKALNSSSDRRLHVVAKTGISESKSDVIIQDLLHKGKESSIWKWKRFKALAHIRNHQFNCCFFLHVHAIEGLPPNFDNLNLCVTWKRKADMLRTRAARVCLGMAEFEETLVYQSTVYGSKTGPHCSATYEPNIFLICASVMGAPGLDIGNHWIDLSRLLPLTLEELEGDKRSSGKWTTSFKLTGEAKGAMLNVSFGFSILDGNLYEPGYSMKLPDIVMGGGLNHFTDVGKSSRTSQVQNFGSVSRISTEGLYHHSQLADVKFSELSHSVPLSHQKLDEGRTGTVVDFDLYHEYSESLKPNSELSPESEFNDIEFDVIEQGVEVEVEKCDSSVIEIIDVAEIFKEEETTFNEYVEWNSKSDANNHEVHECAIDDLAYGDNSKCVIEPAFEELDSAVYHMSTTKPVELDSMLDMSKYYELEDCTKSESTYKAENLTKSVAMVDVAESIENDFLNMLSIDPCQDDIVSRNRHDLPRDFLTWFQDEAPSWEKPILDTYITAEQESFPFTPSCYRKVAFADDFDLSISSQAVERSRDSTNQSLRSRRNAEILENLETEALMHEWGLNEKAFEYSPHACSYGFGSPVYLPAEEPLKLPCIGDGLGPIISTKDGGLLRSMNPLLFRNAKNDARLIMQVSAPVVLPAAMGLTNREILRCWASAGAKEMCIQANELMPMEDVTGKKMQQALSKAAESRSNALQRGTMQQEPKVGVESFVEKKPDKNLLFVQSSDTLNSCQQIESDYVSFEDLVPMAVTNIESLLVEGLKIQSGMPDQEASSEIFSNFISERASSLQVLDIYELLKCSLSLTEWMKLDSGELYVEDETDENISKLFAAHCVKPIESGSGWPTREDEIVGLLRRRCSALGNNFTMGLKAQLRDPLRNYEAVGSSMLALFQVERVYLSSTILDFEQNQKKIYEPLFKVSEVHLAGLNVLHGDKQLWGTSRQQQSGSRWLLSSGMAKSNKNLTFNSNAVTKSSSGLKKKALTGDVLWSISFPIQDEAGTWDEQVALNVHVRNPDIIFPTEFV